MRKILLRSVFSALALLYTSSCHAHPLEKHLWKHRVLIIFGEKDHSKAFTQVKEELSDRHLVYYHTKPNGKTISNHPTPLTVTQLNSVITQYQKNNLTDNKVDTTIVLIGKDGKIKQRWDKLDFKAIFALIDTMPMRQREMQSQQNNPQ